MNTGLKKSVAEIKYSLIISATGLKGSLISIAPVNLFDYNLRKKSEVFRLRKEYIPYNKVSISQFDERNTMQIFDRLGTDRGLVVFKNGQPIAVILSPEEYTRLVEAEEDYKLTVEANRRLEENGEKPTIPFGDILKKLKICEEDLSRGSDPQI